MSEECCSQTESSLNTNCPLNGMKGKRVKTITLKSLLKPKALETLNAEANYFFCDSIDCPVVYFNDRDQTFILVDLKIPVFQKDKGFQVPVCYCFDWTRDRICVEIQQTNNSTVESSIRAHIQAGRCGCEVNNPQGSCCLNNIHQEVKKHHDDKYNQDK